MHTITRRFEFDAAHRVLNHGSKCKHLHGHRYVADVTVTAPGLDGLNMVIDFSVVKKLIGEWIDAQWDHNILLNSLDPLADLWIGDGSVLGSHGHQVVVRDRDRYFEGKMPYLFKEQNPTAEVIAEALFLKAERLLPQPLTVVAVRVWETPNCYADFSR